MLQLVLRCAGPLRRIDPATGAAKRTRIATGRISGGLVAVTAGLKAGDQVVVDGAGYLTDGEKVSIATASAAIPASATDRGRSWGAVRGSMQAASSL